MIPKIGSVWKLATEEFPKDTLTVIDISECGEIVLFKCTHCGKTHELTVDKFNKLIQLGGYNVNSN